MVYYLDCLINRLKLNWTTSDHWQTLFFYSQILKNSNFGRKSTRIFTWNVFDSQWSLKFIFIRMKQTQHNTLIYFFFKFLSWVCGLHVLTKNKILNKKKLTSQFYFSYYYWVFGEFSWFQLKFEFLTTKFEIMDFEKIQKMMRLKI